MPGLAIISAQPVAGADPNIDDLHESNSRSIGCKACKVSVGNSKFVVKAKFIL